MCSAHTPLWLPPRASSSSGEHAPACKHARGWSRRRTAKECSRHIYVPLLVLCSAASTNLSEKLHQAFCSIVSRQSPVFHVLPKTSTAASNSHLCCVCIACTQPCTTQQLTGAVMECDVPGALRFKQRSRYKPPIGADVSQCSPSAAVGMTSLPSHIQLYLGACMHR